MCRSEDDKKYGGIRGYKGPRSPEGVRRIVARTQHHLLRITTAPMPSLRAIIAAGLACLAGSAAAAGEIEVRLLRGVCYPYSGSFPTDTGNAYVGELELRPAGTGTFLDDLPSRFGSIFSQQRGTSPWYTVSLGHGNRGVPRAGG